jgi:predicted oxidoreductase
MKNYDVAEPLNQLEKIRRKYQEQCREIGSLYDYLDKGCPSENQADETWRSIRQLEKAEKISETELMVVISNLKSQNPALLSQWIEYHIKCCQTIISETSGGNKHDGSFNSVRVYSAEQAMKEWSTFLKRKGKIPDINSHFLNDYEIILDSIIASNNQGNDITVRKEK